MNVGRNVFLHKSIFPERASLLCRESLLKLSRVKQAFEKNSYNVYGIIDK